jgi:D-ribose pyranose/furanose isomerase RbsD
VPKVAQISEISGNFGCFFYLATKIQILALKIRILFHPQKMAKESDLWIPIPGSVTTLTLSAAAETPTFVCSQGRLMQKQKLEFDLIAYQVWVATAHFHFHSLTLQAAAVVA